MEKIFYTALALHVAGKPVNKENVRAVLSAAGTPVDDPALDAVAAFIDSLEASRREKGRSADPRIIRFLTSELMHHKVQAKRLQAVLAEVSNLAASVPTAGKTIPTDGIKSVASGEMFALKDVFSAESTVVNARPDEAAESQGSAANHDCRGRYLYGVASTGGVVQLGSIGIEGNSVYTVPCDMLCAIVHKCAARPYQSNDDQTVKNWVQTHQSVLDMAKELLGTIIPMSFDTILEPKDDSTSPDQVVKDWLMENYNELEALLREVEGKDEYGVQVFFEPAVISQQLIEQSQNIRRLKEEISTKSPGMAYMYRQKLEKMLKGEMDKLADRWFKDFYSRVGKYASNTVVERTRKPNGDKKMLLNLSCLVPKENVDSLGEELEEINKMDGFSVHFSGPWPPYSFVAKPMISPGKME